MKPLLILFAACLILSGCKTPEVKSPDLSQIGSKVGSASVSVKKAQDIASASASTIQDVVKTGAKPNDDRVLKLQSDNAKLSALLFSAMDDLKTANSIIPEKQKEADANAAKANYLQAKLDAIAKVIAKTNLLISVLTVAAFLVGQILTKVYSSQITGFLAAVPILGSLATEFIGLIGGTIAFAIFFAVLAFVQGPIGWIIGLFL